MSSACGVYTQSRAGRRSGRARVTVTVPLFVVSAVLVAVMVTFAGAGYGVMYSPAKLSVPGLRLPQERQLSAQVTALLKLPVPVTVAVNCCCVPIIAVLGETETEVTMPGWL